MRLAAAGLAAAWVLVQAPPASAQDAPPALSGESLEYGPEPPPQVMGPFPEDGAPQPAAEPSAGDAQNTAPSEYDRLLGDAKIEPKASSGPPPLPTPQMPIWLWGLLGIMLLALVVSRRSLFPKLGEDEGIRVTSRTSLGREGNLAVVEVGDGTGGRRRLLVGFGAGAPRLVADLTPMPEVLSLAEETLGPRPVPARAERGPQDEPPPAAARSERAPRRGASRTSTPSPAPTPSREAPPAPAGALLTTSQRWESVLEAEAAQPAPRRATRPLESRGDLIAEVLAERTRRSVEVNGDIDLDDDLLDEDAPAVRGTYTFRGTQG